MANTRVYTFRIHPALARWLENTASEIDKTKTNVLHMALLPQAINSLTPAEIAEIEHDIASKRKEGCDAGND